MNQLLFGAEKRLFAGYRLALFNLLASIKVYSRALLKILSVLRNHSKHQKRVIISILLMSKRKATNDVSNTLNDKTSASKKARTGIDRDQTPRKIDVEEMKKDNSLINIVSANVNGLRSVLKKENKTYLQKLLHKTSPDVFCIQEHKLQEHHAKEIDEELVRIEYIFFLL